jgi:uncharacterized protein (DUF58 family)
MSSPELQLEYVDPMDWRQFLIAVKKLADSFNYGTDRSPFLGSGVEYVQSRPYQFGDPVRSIDWRITARTGKFFVKQFETPKQMPVYLIIDTSASMVVSSQRRSKFFLALQVASGLGLACLDRVSPVGIVTTDMPGYEVEPSLSRDQIFQWLHQLRRFRVDRQTHLAKKIDELSRRLTQRSLLITLSDLHQPEALGSLRQAAQRHECVAIQFQDAIEPELPKAGFIRSREAETGELKVVAGGSRLVHPEQIANELKRSQIDHILVRNDQPFAYRLRWFFKSRGVLGKGAR